jgi:CheY-like chemotaxis protein
MKILVVDDDADFLTLLQTILEKHSYEVITARCGNDAAKIIEAGDIDAVLTDYQMPNGDGTVVMRAVRLHPEYIPLILISGRVNDIETLSRFVCGNFLGLLTKEGLNEEKLIRAVEEAHFHKMKVYAMGDSLEHKKFMSVRNATLETIAEEFSSVVEQVRKSFDPEDNEP